MRASVYIATSLDGYIARENGDLDWLPQPTGDIKESAEDYGYQEFMDSVDVLVMGRNTYEKVLSFGPWPYGAKQVIVLSSKPVQIPQDLAETVGSRSCSPIELVEELSVRGANHLYIDGGKTVQSFLRAGLIQQIIISTIPVLIGSGIPLFGWLDEDVKLQHVKTKAFASGIVQSHYELSEYG